MGIAQTAQVRPVVSRLSSLLIIATLVSCNTYKKVHGVLAPAKERTLWEVCWDGMEMELPSDTPPHTPKCKKPQAIVWPGAQIRIATLYDDEALDMHLDLAIAQWNKWLGWEMFVRTRLAFDVIVLYQPPQMWFLGMAHLHREAGVLAGAIEIFGYVPERAYHTILHEMGHILGLAHDVDGSGGLMCPSCTDMVPARADLEAIRKLYI